MKRIYMACAVIAVGIVLAGPAQAQMGMNLFQKPAITKFVNPVVGKGAQYESTHTGSGSDKATSMEMGVTAKETVDGKDGFWLQFSATSDKGQPMVAKGLFTKDDFQVHQMIIQIPGRGAMQMPVNPNAPGNNKIQNSMVDWHSVGTESITVPAGTFVCEHWRNEKDGSDVWVSDKVTPFGLVKQVSAKDTMVLTKLLTDVTDQIPGPVTKFDPQMMMQQMQQQRQSQQKQ